MTEFKTNKQYLKQTSPKKLKPPTPQQQAFSTFIQQITQQGLKGQDFRTARENFLSTNFSSSAEEEIFQEEKEREYFTRLERSFDVARELRGY